MSVALLLSSKFATGEVHKTRGKYQSYSWPYSPKGVKNLIKGAKSHISFPSLDMYLDKKVCFFFNSIYTLLYLPLLHSMSLQLPK